MEFRILGPLEVVADGRPLELGGPKQRALLALLLLETNRVVSADRLIDALWEDGAPETAQKALQVYVSQLRKVLGKERLQRKAPGYLLVVRPGELDLERFQTLQREGRSQEALQLWRGRALADFAYQAFAQAEVDRLEELRLACLEERIDHDLGQARHKELVGELDALVKSHPLRERLREQHMLALYRSGRQAEALGSYQAARVALVDELGIEPGRSLRDLQQAILNQHEALDPAEGEHPTPEPASEPPSPTPRTRETRKTVTALFVGVELSPVSGDGLDPEALRRVTGLVFGSVRGAADRHGGTIETVAGDAITAVFGLPTVHEDDALRAVRAAVEARESLTVLAASLVSERDLRLDYRIGVSTGEVVTGSDADQLRATGEPLTLASRLAAPGEVVIDQATHRLVRDVVVVDPQGDGWRIVELADQATAPAGRLVSPMVGRVRERRRLKDAFEQAVAARSCQLFTVLGLAGVGKSRLVHEFLAGLGDRALVARGRCLPYGEGITYWPLAEAVKEAVGLEDGDSPEEVQGRMIAALGEIEDAAVIARRVAETIGLLDPAGSSDERVGAVQALLEAIARSRPLVVVFDDIHWGESTFLDLVEHLASWAREAPILLVCLARPELIDLRPAWGGGKLDATTALLEPLSDEECERLIENLVGPAGLPKAIEERIAAAAEGNPLYVEEMLSMLIDDGLLVRLEGRWTANGDIAAVRVPPTIQALLATRLDQLDADERAVIERAAVAGKVFQEGAVAELTYGASRAGVADSLRSLLRKELIRPERASLGDRTYRFRHLLIRDAAYAAIPKEARAELHERFGRWLDGATGERAADYEEVVGYHLEQACRYRTELGPADDAVRALAKEAVERLGSAGRRAFIRSDGPAGVNLISRAVALLPPDDPMRVELVPNVRVVQGLGGDLLWADRVLTEAVEAAATSGDRRLAARALVQRGLLRMFTVPAVTPEEFLDTAERSIMVFEELRDELGLARAWRLKAQAHYLARRGGACAEASERALEHARTAGDRFEERETVEWLVIALLLGPAPAAEAAERCRRLIEEMSDDPLLQAELLAALAPLEAMLGHLSEASELLAQARETTDALGEWIWIASFWRAFIALWNDDPVEAERELLPAYEALRRIGEKSHFSSIAHALSNALYAQGRYEEAERLTHECEEASGPNDVHSQINWRAIRAKTLARRGETEAAERLAREAVAYAEASDFLLAHADALADLAEVLTLRDGREAAAAAFRQSIDLHARKGNLLGVERIRVRLVELLA